MNFMLLNMIMDMVAFGILKTKTELFAFLWQKFLDIRGDASDEYIQEAFKEMNEFYQIEDFGSVHVCSFED